MDSVAPTTQTRTADAGNSEPRETVTITDNRTGKSYEDSDQARNNPGDGFAAD